MRRFRRHTPWPWAPRSGREPGSCGYSRRSSPTPPAAGAGRTRSLRWRVDRTREMQGRLLWPSTMGTPAGELLAKIDAGVLGRTLLEAAGAARIGVTVTLLDALCPRTVYVSEAAAELLGWSVEELLEGDPLH